MQEKEQRLFDRIQNESWDTVKKVALKYVIDEIVHHEMAKSVTDGLPTNPILNSRRFFPDLPPPSKRMEGDNIKLFCAIILSVINNELLSDEYKLDPEKFQKQLVYIEQTAILLPLNCKTMEKKLRRQRPKPESTDKALLEQYEREIEDALLERRERVHDRLQFDVSQMQTKNAYEYMETITQHLMRRVVEDISFLRPSRRAPTLIANIVRYTMTSFFVDKLKNIRFVQSSFIQGFLRQAERKYMCDSVGSKARRQSVIDVGGKSPRISRRRESVSGVDVLLGHRAELNEWKIRMQEEMDFFKVSPPTSQISPQVQGRTIHDSPRPSPDNTPPRSDAAASSLSPMDVLNLYT